MEPGSWSSFTGKYVNSICPARTSASDAPTPSAAQIVNSLPGMNSGAKKGNPWMWSQWVWLSRMLAFRGRGPFFISSMPNGRAPVPESKISRCPASVVISTQQVFPP